MKKEHENYNRNGHAITHPGDKQEAQFPAVDTRRRTAEAYALLSTNIRLCTEENIISARYVPSQTLSAPPYSGLGRSPKIATNLVSRAQGCQQAAHLYVAAVHTDEAASDSIVDVARGRGEAR